MDMGALFAGAQQRWCHYQGMKKVTDDMKVYKNKKLRKAGGVKSRTSRNHCKKKKAAAKKKLPPPKCEFENAAYVVCGESSTVARARSFRSSPSRRICTDVRRVLP